ncbi:hypothetical protein GWO43_16800 [candidate division KSB1 bacterium]|nr:hypothetical protein [candidate division KSB1 bacterium]NIR69074.1 hypothetical protein [candidate division KSB1 bacterium]NIS25636.1 hypothetical protein [candidate division KSB1 bacterium]NIT72500.1 hypothetical protein [candidate division KSB1 bacterium]NIU26313.1 hypothetical protein [candidate division KSB1 bacterium]
MIDQKYLELINKDVDGNISSSEKSKLEAYLVDNPKARKIHRELIQLSKMLNQMEDVPPNPNLKKGVLNSIQVNKYAKKKTRSTFGSRLRSPNWRLNYNLAVSFAAGLVLGLLVFAILNQSLNKLRSFNDPELIGSIVLKDVASKLEPVDRVQIKENGVSATFETLVAQDVVLLEASVTTPPNTDMALEFEDADLHFRSFSQSKDAHTNLELLKNRLELRNTGQNEYLFVFDDRSSDISSLTVEIYIDDFEFHETVLTGNRTP